MLNAHQQMCCSIEGFGGCRIDSAHTTHKTPSINGRLSKGCSLVCRAICTLTKKIYLPVIESLYFIVFYIFLGQTPILCSSTCHVTNLDPLFLFDKCPIRFYDQVDGLHLSACITGHTFYVYSTWLKRDLDSMDSHWVLVSGKDECASRVTTNSVGWLVFSTKNLVLLFCNA